MYLKSTKNTVPSDNPNRIWLTLWTPRYNLDTGIIKKHRANIYPQGLYLIKPIVSDIIGSYNKITAKLCPLGLPKSLGHIQSKYEILLSYQIGLDCWNACFNNAMIYVANMK